MYIIKSFHASVVLGCCFSVSVCSMLSADEADLKDAALSKKEISAPPSTPSEKSASKATADAKKTKPKTLEERAELAAKAAGYSSLCLTSLYMVYTLLVKAVQAARYDPYAVLPSQDPKYLEEARLDNIIFRPCRIAGALVLSSIILGAHYKFKFYDEARKNLRSLFAN